MTTTTGAALTTTHGVVDWVHGHAAVVRTTTEPALIASIMSEEMSTGALRPGICAVVITTEELSRASLAAAGSLITRPEILRNLDKAVRLPASLIEEAFLSENPRLEPDMLTVTCRQGYIQEVRICLTRDLDPRICGRDVIRDCSATDALFTPVR